MEEKLGLERWVCTSWGGWDYNGPLGITLYDVKLRKSAFEEVFPEVVDCVQIDGENSTITIKEQRKDVITRTFKLILTVGEEVK